MGSLKEWTKIDGPKKYYNERKRGRPSEDWLKQTMYNEYIKKTKR